MLRESKRSTPEHKEIEGAGSGQMVYDHGPLGIPYANEVEILGITFSSTIEQSTKNSWAIVTESEPRGGTLTRGTYAFLSGFGMCTHTS